VSLAAATKTVGAEALSPWGAERLELAQPEEEMTLREPRSSHPDRWGGCGGWCREKPELKTQQSEGYEAGISYCGGGHTGDLSSKRARHTPCHFRLNTITVYIFIIFPRNAFFTYKAEKNFTL